jgi:tripartite-type tricarboxylate transporter receptor subunit TctC
MNRRPILALAAAGAAALLVSALPRPAVAQAASDWPTKPVRIVTPFPAGAGPEVVMRTVAEKLGKLWGKPVIVENRPGGNGFIAIGVLKQGDKEGYDLIQLDNVHLSAYPHLFKKLPYDPKADFEPLVPLFKASFFFAVPTASPYKSVGDLIADAKAKPGKLNYGSWSVGNPVHLGSAMFQAQTGTQMEHVIYKETSQLYTGVANGELAFALGSYGTSGSLQRAGRLRYLAVAGPKRLAAYPDVPTVGESGGPADFSVVGWTALAAPKGLSPVVAEKIRRDVEKVLAEPDIAQRYTTFGYELFGDHRAVQCVHRCRVDALRERDPFFENKHRLIRGRWSRP